jgi:hypothetical protein
MADTEAGELRHYRGGSGQAKMVTQIRLTLRSAEESMEITVEHLGGVQFEVKARQRGSQSS